MRNSRGMPLRVLVYAPQPAPSQRIPATVIVQPFNDPPEYARILALELLRAGFVVETFDWHGRVAEENRQALRSEALDVMGLDVTAAVASLRRRSDVDPTRVFVAGHSVGATLAVEAAIGDPSIGAVAAIGMEAVATSNVPRNVLWVIGLHDEFYGLGRMRECFRESTATMAPENTTVGVFADGTARRLAVSLTADHFSELQDRFVHREVVYWFEQAAGMPVGSKGPSMEIRSLLVLAAWLAGLIAAILTVLRLARRWKHSQRLAPAVALLGILFLSRIEDQTHVLTADAMLGLLIVGLAAGALSKVPHEALVRRARSSGRLVLIFWCGLILTLLGNSARAYVEQPARLASVPEFAVRNLLDLLHAYVLVFPRPFVFAHPAVGALAPRIWVLLALTAEIAAPGLLIGVLTRLISRRGARQESPAAPLKYVVILIVLLGALGAILVLRFQQGFLTRESISAAGACILRYVLPPILLFAVLRRFRREGNAGRGA